MATPAVMAHSTAAVDTGPVRAGGDAYTQTKNAMAPMATMPAARPSSPSMRFTAFTRISTQSTVSGTARSDPTITIPCPNGNQKKSSSTPNRMRTPAASTCPATLDGTDRLRTSSIAPIRQISAPATRAPCRSEDCRNNGRNCGTNQAVASPATTPIRSPTPPRVGVGFG